MKHTRHLFCIAAALILPLVLVSSFMAQLEDEYGDDYGVGWTDPFVITNMALPENGGSVSASSEANSNYSVSAINDGDRTGFNWGHGGYGSGWNDGSEGIYASDWVRINFAGARTITEVDVFTLRDNFANNQTPPTLTETFSTADNTGSGIIDFDVQYLSGSGWKNVPNGRIVGNNRVWRQMAFAGITTTAVRVAVHKGAVWTSMANNYSRIVEIEAYNTTGFNVAREQGASVQSSGAVNANYPEAAVNDGDRTGFNWGHGGYGSGWNDNTEGVFSADWVQVNFDQPKKIEMINVVTLGDGTQPTLSQTFSTADNTGQGITYYEVQYWDNQAPRWRTVDCGNPSSPCGLIIGNNNVWRQLTFPAVRMDKIRVAVRNAVTWTSIPNNYSRIVEVEAYGKNALTSISEPLSNEVGGVCNDPTNKTQPCHMMRNLLAAMQLAAGQPSLTSSTPLPYGPPNDYAHVPAWWGHLAWDYAPWGTIPGSNNLPVIAHAITLWRNCTEYRPENPALCTDPTVPDAIKWWQTYLDCQSGETCTVNKKFINKWKGAETFSNTYDAITTTSVIAVHFWANKKLKTISTTNPDYARISDLDTKARRYLRLNWGLYTLGAGKRDADKLNTRLLQDFPCVPSYTGPFMPFAGMRATPFHACANDAGPLFARALNWAVYTGNPYIGEASLKDVWDYMEANYTDDDIDPDPPDVSLQKENLYGLTLDLRTKLKGHVDGTSDQTTLLFSFLNKIRTAVTYHFAGMTNGTSQVRITVMEDNDHYATPTFAGIYDSGSKTAWMLFPWVNHIKPQCPVAKVSQLFDSLGKFSKGYAEFRLDGQKNDFSPNQIYSTSKNRDGSSQCRTQDDYGNPIEDIFYIPSTWVWKYHIKFTATDPPVRIR